MEHTLYTYKATVTDVYDGDTLTIEIDLGFNVHLKKEKVRLHRINAPEVKGRSKKQGLVARDFLRSLVLKKEITLQTIKDRKEKYGRYLGEVWLKSINTDINVNDEMVKRGFAKYQKY